MTVADSPPPLTHAERVAALAACLDLGDLAPADRELLADRLEELTVPTNQHVFPETDREDEDAQPSAVGGPVAGGDPAGLYVIVEGLVSVERRSVQRRAPQQFLVGAGGLFGENFLAGGGMVAARAYRRARLLRLKAADLPWAAQALPSFPAILSRLRTVHLKAPWVVDCLRRSPVLRHVPPRLLYELLEGARLHSYRPGDPIFAAGADPDGVLVVLNGEVVLTEPIRGHAVRLLVPGDLLGDLEFLDSRGAAYAAAATTSVRLLQIPAARLNALVGRSSTLRRSLMNCSFGHPEQRRRLLERVAASERQVMNLVAFIGDDPRLPLRRLAEWAAEASAAEFGDRIVLLVVEDPGPREPEVTPAAVGEGEVLRVRLSKDHPLLRDPEAVLRVALHSQYVFWAGEGLSLQELPPEVASAERVVYLASRPYGELPPYLETHLPRPLIYTAVVPAPALPDGAVPIVPLGNVRLHRDVVSAARGQRSLGDLPEEQRIQIGRLARAVTRRRVGLALGGGGPFGYAHLPLIRAIHAAGIPIDLVAGSSIGSVLGAYYASRGLAGVDQFFAEAADFGKQLMPRAVWNSDIIARSIEKALGRGRLEDLVVPFYPVAVDIDRACEVTVRHGPIAVGVRASCALPGPFAPVVVQERQPGEAPRLVRLVDGGVINMVPDDTLYLEGAQVVVASNVIPPPRPRAMPTSTRLRVATQRALALLPLGGQIRLHEIDPLLRGDDVIRTMFMLMHVPADWHARTADAKFHARADLHAPMSWDHGAAIMKAQDPERVRRTVEKLALAYQAMRWRNLDDRQPVDSGDEPA